MAVVTKAVLVLFVQPSPTTCAKMRMHLEFRGCEVPPASPYRGRLCQKKYYHYCKHDCTDTGKPLSSFTFRFIQRLLQAQQNEHRKTTVLIYISFYTIASATTTERTKVKNCPRLHFVLYNGFCKQNCT